jgi:hypothetical protein
MATDRYGEEGAGKIARRGFQRKKDHWSVHGKTFAVAKLVFFVWRPDISGASPPAPSTRYPDTVRNELE